jgi:glycosyltransferase involved in cell wall biosynthesis
MGVPWPTVSRGAISENLVTISAYYQRVRLWNPTGAGKHIDHMTRRLSQALGGLQHIHGSDDHAFSMDRGVPGVAFPDTLCRLPLPRRVFEGAWMMTDWPPVDFWSGRPDWIYCPAEYYVAARRSQLAVTVHCDNWFNNELPWYHDKDIVATRRRRHGLYQSIAKKADLVLCVSNFLRERIVHHFGVPEDRTAVIGNGVEEAFFSPGSIPERFRSLLGGRPYACIIGGLTRRKGGEATVKIIKDMAAAKADCMFVVVGSSEVPYAQALSDLPNVLQVGYVGLEDGLPGLVAGALAVLFLSRYETFGIPAIEAMAAGTVPIVSSYGALPEVVGKEGFILAESQYGEVPQILAGLAKRPPDTRNRDSLKARALQFTWDTCASSALEAMRCAKDRGADTK